MTRPEAVLIDEFEFRSYVHNRMQFPDVSPERWAAIFSNVPEMEERLSALDVADRATGTDGLQVGDEGVRGSTSYRALSEASTENNRGSATAQQERGISDSQTSTPLYLLASEIVDIVTKGYEQ